MDYCVKCDGNIVIRTVMGEPVGICRDCGARYSAHQEFLEKKRKEKLKKLKPKFVCNYCEHEFEDDKYVNVNRDIHVAEEHPDEWELEQADSEMLIRIACFSGDRKQAMNALKQLDDEELQRVVIETYDFIVRSKAITMIDDIRIIRELLNMVKTPKLRAEIIKQRDKLKSR